MGISDQKWFLKISELTLSPIEKVYSLSIHMSYLGLCDLTFNSGLNSTELLEKREKFHIVCSSNCSFESDAWGRSNLPHPSTCCCFLVSGYIAGWIEQSFGISVTCIEKTCRISKSPTCEFIVCYTHNADLFLTDTTKDSISAKIHKYSTFQAIYTGTQDLLEIFSRPYGTPPPERLNAASRTYSKERGNRDSGKSISPPPRPTQPCIEEIHEPLSKLARRKSFDSPRYQELQGKKKEKKKSLKRKQSKDQFPKRKSTKPNTIQRTITSTISPTHHPLTSSQEFPEIIHRRLLSEPYSNEIRSLNMPNSPGEEEHQLSSPETNLTEETDQKRKSKKKKNSSIRKNSKKYQSSTLEKRTISFNYQSNEKTSHPSSPTKMDSPPLKYCSTEKLNIHNIHMSEPDDVQLVLSKSKKRISKKIRGSVLLTSDNPKKPSNS